MNNPQEPVRAHDGKIYFPTVKGELSNIYYISLSDVEKKVAIKTQIDKARRKFKDVFLYESPSTYLEVYRAEENSSNAALLADIVHESCIPAIIATLAFAAQKRSPLDNLAITTLNKGCIRTKIQAISRSSDIFIAVVIGEDISGSEVLSSMENGLYTSATESEGAIYELSTRTHDNPNKLNDWSLFHARFKRGKKIIICVKSLEGALVILGLLPPSRLTEENPVHVVEAAIDSSPKGKIMAHRVNMHASDVAIRQFATIGIRTRIASSIIAQYQHRKVNSDAILSSIKAGNPSVPDLLDAMTYSERNNHISHKYLQDIELSRLGWPTSCDINVELLMNNLTREEEIVREHNFLMSLEKLQIVKFGIGAEFKVEPYEHLWNRQEAVAEIKLARGLNYTRILLLMGAFHKIDDSLFANLKLSYYGMERCSPAHEIKIEVFKFLSTQSNHNLSDLEKILEQIQKLEDIEQRAAFYSALLCFNDKLADEIIEKSRIKELVLNIRSGSNGHSVIKHIHSAILAIERSLERRIV